MKILVPDKVDKIIEKKLTSMGYETDYRPGMAVGDTAKVAKDYDAVLVRSYKLHDVPLKDNVLAVGRAGAGVNNIPVDICTRDGIVVFNAPGANSNAVKELVICGLILASRGISNGIHWTKRLSGDVIKQVEKGKSQFKGTEIMGKKLAVIGLGAIGCQIANAAYSLGMDVAGYDPFITVDNALRLSRSVAVVDDMDMLMSDAEYVTVHVPLSDKTKGLINGDVFCMMRPGTKLLNFSRKEVVNHKALHKALADGTLGNYVTDFPDDELIKRENVIALPHLGASTKEAEENCALMIAEQVHDYLVNGNIRNSVNFPNIHLDRNGSARMLVFNENVPGMVSQISDIFSKCKLNIHGMINRSKGDYAYNIVDIDGKISPDIISKIEKIKKVIRVRVL